MEHQNVVVMGLGEFGGGVGVARWLLSQGMNVCVTDLQTEEALSESIRVLGQHSNLSFALGGHKEVDFENADIVVVNPSVPMSRPNQFLDVARSSGAVLTTEICLLVEQLARKQIIGVTGSAGKSTTVSMIHAAFCHAGKRAWLGGNIGGSLLNDLHDIEEDDVVILELSSAMLWWLDSLHGGWSPHVGVLTNISPNHLDWHGSIEDYKRCKEVIFKHQSEGDTAIVNGIDLRIPSLQVLGMHNALNAQFALAASIAMGIDRDVAIKGIQSYKGLPHRLERVTDWIFNDSKSTTPSATQNAVDAFDNPNQIRLIVGGYDKKIDLTPLADLSERVACMYAIGETRFQIADKASKHCKIFDSLDEAVSQAVIDMQPDDVLLLSPGCASWDQFKNYEERGETFTRLATSLHCANQ